MRAFRAAGSWLLLWSLGWAPPAAAQGAGRSQDIETSIRAAAMGGATAGVAWGEPAPWGNPAALAEARGIAWLATATKLAPSLSGDPTFETRRMLLGGEGLGFSLMGQPVSGLGRTRLEYENEGTDPFGDITTYTTYEQVEGWGVGVSPVQILDAFRLNRDRDARPYSQRADVSFGYQHKTTELAPVPNFTTRADNFDWGVQGRIAILPGAKHGRETRVELGAGYAELNADETSGFDFGNGDPLEPSTRIQRTGLSLHATLPIAGSGEEGAGPWGWWFATVPRALDVGLAYDHESLTSGGLGASTEVDRLGFEASLMGILAGRLGYVSDPDGEIDAMSFGFGVHLPLGPWASLGYDWASVPQPPGSEAIIRQGFAAWVHPVVFWRSTRE